MSKIRLFGTSSGYVEIAPAAAASNNTLTAPSTVGEIIAKDAAGAIGITSMKASNVNVGAAVTITESGIEASGIGITCASINGTQIGGRRNLIINGAMNVAQRATSSSTATAGYHTVDRFRYAIGGHDEGATHAQVDVASGTSPYQSGFRKAYKITNGNQTSGAGSSDYIQIDYYVEAQDVANSGWDITNPNSFLTFSFWMKSSVSQFFTFAIRCKDGTEQVINFKTPVLSADTWTKVIKRIPGNSNLTVNNDNGQGLQFMFFPFIGTDYSTVGLAEDTWSSWASAKHAVPNTTTWWTTNDSTWEITGLQLEVGTEATPFEHRSFTDELALCQRYYYKSTQYSYTIQNPIDSAQTVDGDGFLGWVFYNNTSCRSPHYNHPVEMRATPTVNFYSSDRVASPSDGKMALYTLSAWVNLSSNTATVNTRRLAIKGLSATSFSPAQVYLIGGGFECGAEL